MTAGTPKISIADNNLVVDGKNILTGVPQNVISTPGSRVGLVEGAFIGVTDIESRSHHVFPVGKLDGLRLMCLLLFKLWLITHRMGTCGRDDPLESKFMLVESKQGSPFTGDSDYSQKERTIYPVFLPLLEGQFRAVLQGNDRDEIEICLESGDSAVKTNQSLYPVYMHAEPDPFEVIIDAVRPVEKYLETFNHSKEEKAMDDLKEICKMGLLVTEMNLLVYVWAMVLVLGMWQLYSLEFIGGSLAICISSITDYTVLCGLATSMEAVCGQAFCSSNFGLMSLALQCTIVIVLSAFIPICHLETFMISLVHHPQIIRIASKYCRYDLPGLLANSHYHPLRIFIYLQGIKNPMMWSSLLAVVAHFPLTWLLIFVPRLGVSGAIVATGCTNLNMMNLLVHVVYRSPYKPTWSGWSGKSIKDWWGSIIRTRINLRSFYLAFTLKSNSALRLDRSSLTAIAFLLLYFCGGGVDGRQFTLMNKCRYVVWPAIQPDAGHVVIARGGMRLPSQMAKTIETPPGWSGRIWGRRDCTFDESGKHGYCSTGDCGGALFCNGAGLAPPATIVEITLSANSSAPDLYDVSLVQGYNLPVIISPSEGGSGKCRVAGCTNDVNVVCPNPLQVVEKGSVVACNSACLVFNSPKYCCTGRSGELITCRSNTLSELFKNACPLAYSYASDKAGSLVTCAGGHNYMITFCPGN